jgi:hypothetical protein
MKFRVDCVCGDHIMVSEGAAGATFDCACGRTIEIPSLSDLRTRAGLPTNALSPEFIIEHLLAAGQMSLPTACLECGAEPCPTVCVRTECERAILKRSGGISWPIVIFCLIFCQPFLVWYLWSLFVYPQAQEETEYGRDKVYSLPLPICSNCRDALRDTARIKALLGKVAEYRMLLEKFPNASVAIETSF